MQHKNYFVALLCGALCLTGCLKNEESASVAQVREGKANELNANAEFLKAQAAATTTLAGAEAILKQAQAELEKANAALVQAQAETEKVRAELLKVQVQLQSVKVEEERVELQKKEAELEGILAELAATQAKAEAEKQQWINELESLIAQAAVDQVKAQQEIIKAQAEMDAYLNTLASDQAESAKDAAAKYFAALDEVVTLQNQKLANQAWIELIDAGAVNSIEVANNQIAEKQAEIAEKEADIAYLKEYQSMEPEEAAAKLDEAYKALTAAATDWKNVEAEVSKLKSEKDVVDGKTSDFYPSKDAWRSAFGDKIRNNFPYYAIYDVYEYAEEGVNAPVKYSGMLIPAEEEGADPTFIPLWRYEQSFGVTERYPDVDVYVDDLTKAAAVTSSDFINITNTIIAPAEIYYDNMEAVTALMSAANKTYFEDVIDDFVTTTEEFIEDGDGLLFTAGPKQVIAANNAKLELHEKYIAERKEAVEKAEEKFRGDVANIGTTKENEATTWTAFQEYMLVKYDVSREVFINRYNAQVAYNEAKGKSDATKSALDGKKAGIAAYEAAVETAITTEANAEGAYNVAKAKIKDTGEEAALTDAKKAYNPDFVSATAKKDGDVWKDAKKNVAGTAQAATLDADVVVAEKQEALDNAELELLRYPKGTDEYKDKKAARDAAEENLTKAQGDYNDAVKAEGKARTTYETALGEYNDVYGETEAAAKVWNPDFGSLKGATIENYTTKGTYNKNKKQWEKGTAVAGTAQAALLDAFKALVEANADVVKGGKTYEAWATADKATKEAESTLNDKNNALIAALKGAPVDPKKDKVEDYLDEEADDKYKAYLDAKKAAEAASASYDALQALYLGFNPDAEDAGDENEYGEYKDADFSWLLSNYHVDYNATMLNKDGETVSIAEFLFGKTDEVETTYEVYFNDVTKVFDWEQDKKETGEVIPDITKSLKYQNELCNNIIESSKTWEAEAKQIAEEKVTENDKWLNSILASAKTFQSHEANYVQWVEERTAAEAAWNEAKKAEFDAIQKRNAAKAEYDAIKAVAEKGIWQWDEEEDDYVKVSIAEAIEALNEEIATLEGEIDEINTTLEQSANFAAYVKANLEQEIATIEAKIVVYQTIADMYKALLDQYLGVEETPANQ